MDYGGRGSWVDVVEVKGDTRRASASGPSCPSVSGRICLALARCSGRAKHCNVSLARRVRVSEFTERSRRRRAARCKDSSRLNAPTKEHTRPLLRNLCAAYLRLAANCSGHLLRTARAGNSHTADSLPLLRRAGQWCDMPQGERL